MIKAFFALFLMSFAARAGTIATADCGNLGSDTEAVTASCDVFGTYLDGAAYASATAQYGQLSATAGSFWGVPGCIIACQIDAYASAEFVQSMTFTGLSGTGTLVFPNNGVANSYSSGFVTTQAYLSGFVNIGPAGVVVPPDYWQGNSYTGFPYFHITFGVPFQLDGYVSSFGTDNGPVVSETMNLGSFFVLDSNGNELQTWAALGNFPAANYSLLNGSVTAAPEPATLILVGVGIVLMAQRRRRSSQGCSSSSRTSSPQ
jgi:hypothetical protein